MKSNKTYSFISRFAVFFFILMAIGWVAWFWWKDSITPVDTTNTTPVLFVVKSGEGVKSIAANLTQQNLIRSPTGFYILVKVLGLEKQIQAGDFRLNPSMDARTIAYELTHGILDLWVTTLEGWRDEEVAAKIAKDFDIPEQQFITYSKEGYMFPDTYLIPRDATAAAITTIMFNNFDKKFTDTMKQDVGKTGLTTEKAVILASIVEREGRSTLDRPVIAGILLKRLKADWPLQVDATLQYALGYQSYEKTWWKKYLTEEDKNIVSPYNTYRNTGLPPGPICNPGLESLQAVVYPKDSEYWYYLHDPSGVVHYATTIEEHNANISKYLQ